MKELHFTLLNKALLVKVNDIESGQYIGYVNTEILRPSNRRSEINESQTASYTHVNEFVSDLQFLVDRINARGSISPNNSTLAFRDSIVRHINGCGRLIITDLYTYIDCILHILNAFDGLLLLDEVSKTKAFDYYLDKTVSEFKEYIYVIKPWGLVKMA